MPYNLPSTAAPFFALPDHALVALDGPDAAAFAQAQFANDVIGLVEGSWQWNTWLTPKGRVIAVFALLKLAGDRILLLVPDVSTQELATKLQQFVFRRKLKITARDDMQVGGAWYKSSTGQNARIGQSDGAIELDYGDDAVDRTLVIRQASLPSNPGHAISWLAADLRAGLPRLSADQRERWTPQQLSLERLHAFSVKKGCYPGQEIVARTHFLGKAKRGIVLFEADSAIETGADVSDGERVIGSIVSSVRNSDVSLALAVLPLDRPAASLHANGASLAEVALQSGLER